MIIKYLKPCCNYENNYSNGVKLSIICQVPTPHHTLEETNICQLSTLVCSFFFFFKKKKKKKNISSIRTLSSMSK